METIPISAKELNINFEGYESVAENIRRMSAVSITTRLEILKEEKENYPQKK